MSDLVASLRDAQQIVEIAKLGHDCFTISPSVAHDLFQNDFTAVDVANFEKICSGRIIMITVGGENLIDYVQTALNERLPVYTAIPGGSCYNVAIAIARQDQPVTYVTPISVDGLGNILADRLLADGVKIGAPRSPAPTSLAIVSVSEGQPSYQFYRNGTAERDISAQHLDESIKNSTRIFHIGSLSLIDGEDADLWEHKFRELYQNGVITSLDPNARPVGSMIGTLCETP